MSTENGDEVSVLKLTLHGRLVGYLAGFSHGRNVLSFAGEFTGDPHRPAFSLITHPGFPRAEKILSEPWARNQRLPGGNFHLSVKLAMARLLMPDIHFAFGWRVIMKTIHLLVILCIASSAVFTTTVTADAISERPEIKKEIIDRCRASMNSFGASMVKFCVEQDIDAFNHLAAYPAEWSSVIERCKRDMLAIGGWEMVKFCADEDIAAEKALRDM